MFIEVATKLTNSEDIPGEEALATEELYFSTMNIMHIVYFIPSIDTPGECNVMLNTGSVITVHEDYDTLQRMVARAQAMMGHGIVINLDKEALNGPEMDTDTEASNNG